MHVKQCLDLDDYPNDQYWRCFVIECIWGAWKLWKVLHILLIHWLILCDLFVCSLYLQVMHNVLILSDSKLIS